MKLLIETNREQDVVGEEQAASERARQIQELGMKLSCPREHSGVSAEKSGT
jgi:hypothetical protein